MIKFYDTFPAHFFIEMCYARKNKFGFIYEQNLSHKDFDFLCESYGVFDGCAEIAEEIMYHCFKAYEENEADIEIQIRNCSFIDEIEISLIYGKICSFNHINSKFVNNKYNPLYLNIGIYCIENNQKALIMHELLHAYEEYRRYTTKAQNLHTKAGNIGYYKNPISQTPYYYGKNKKIVSYVLYHLTDFERNAYIASINGLFNDTKERFKDINQALQYIKQTIIYQNYQKIFEWAELLCNETNQETQNQILYYVKELSNNEFNTYNQFVKWLSNKVLKYKRKFNTIIPKIASERLIMSETLNTPIDYLID